MSQRNSEYAKETFLNGKVTMFGGDCLEILATLPENSIDSCVTDPPYHLSSIYKRFGKSLKYGERGLDPGGAMARLSRGFMGQLWDGGNIAQSVDLWREVLRVLKPGAHLLAFGGTRTYHRMACAIEDAGFEIRDCIQWLYGSGFPKSHDVSKGIDRAAGAEREKVSHKNPRNQKATGGGRDGMAGASRPWIEAAIKRGYHELDSDIPATDAARQWQGWGTALKPACEPIVLARKPLSEKTVAANVLKWGTGAINVDGCRVLISDNDKREMVGRSGASTRGLYEGNIGINETWKPANGRWPANVIHDGSEEVVEGFPHRDCGMSIGHNRNGDAYMGGYSGAWRKDTRDVGYNDEGSAARFFYTAKADSDDRLGSKHPTVKPLDLMQYLIRLVTPQKGTVVDPFAGTGTTGEAAWREGMGALLIEREAEYQADIRRRMALCLSGPDERARESIKAKLKDKPLDHGPLFGGGSPIDHSGRQIYGIYADENGKRKTK